jgi:hypothetical protein
MSFSMTSSVARIQARAAPVARGASFKAAAPLRAVARRERVHVVRASEEPVEAAPVEAAKEAEAPAPYVAPTPVVPEKKSLKDLMAFAGPAPELINGRAAMIAFVAGAYAEAYTGKPILAQLACEPGLVALFVAAMTAATFAPLLQGEDSRESGPFKRNAEMINGRAAMLGFAALLLVESNTGAAFF